MVLYLGDLANPKDGLNLPQTCCSTRTLAVVLQKNNYEELFLIITFLSPIISRCQSDKDFKYIAELD